MTATVTSRRTAIWGRPEMTAGLMLRTGVNKVRLTDPVHRFYAKAHADAVL